jgi:hypothetical protein
MQLSRNPECFPPRIARADQHLALGEWATSHAIVSALLRCSARDGCADKQDCACAATSMLCHVRRLLVG